MISPAPGTLLIANPFLKDPNFMRTVIFICEHKPEGTFGFVLNKKISQTLNEFIPELQDYKIPVFYGGPVQKNTLHFLHQYPHLISNGEEVYKNVYRGGNFESLILHIKNNDIDFDKIRFFIGYSGWGDGQLDEEMKEKSWLTVGALHKLIFHKTPEDIWKDSLTHLGGDYKMMINFPTDPQLN
jgi:putative transcriptional regulator